MTGGMTPEEFQNYLGLLSRMLRLRATEREAIEEELRSHLEERLAALTAQGIEPARAVSMALAEFGDAAALAAEFTAVSRFYKRRWIMRLTVGSIAASIIMVAVLFSYLPGGPGQMNQNLAQAQQTEKSVENIKSTPEKLDANTQTQAKLEKLIDAEFVEQPLSQVLDYISDDKITGVQFHIDIRSITEAGITTDTPITFHMKNMSAEMILRLMFRDFSSPLGYWLEDGVVIVTTQDEVESHLETRFYRINDLVDIANENISIEWSTTRTSPPLPESTSEDNASKRATGRSLQNIKADYEVNMDNLIDVITTTIKPTSWDIVGGPGAISEYRGVLVVSQTAEVHREIPKLLDKLRKLIDRSLPIVRSKLQRDFIRQEKAKDKDNAPPSSPFIKDNKSSGGESGLGGGGGLN